MRLFPVVMVISALGLPALAQEVMPLDQAFVQQRLNAETLKTANDRQELAKNRVSVDTMQKRQTQGLDRTVCLPIKNVDVRGNSVLPQQVIDDITYPYNGTCMSLHSIDKLNVELTNAYLVNGYVATRVYIPDQDISTGVIKFIVVEGKLEDFYWDGQSDKKRRNIRAAFPGLTGQVLNLRDLEQGFEQLNRLRSQNVKIGLLPGSKAGQTIVNLVDEPQSPFYGSYRFGAKTQSQGPEYSHKLSLGYENLVGFNDTLGVSITHTNDDALPINATDAGNRIDINYSMTYGAWSLGADVSHYVYHRTEPALAVASDGQWGKSRSFGVNADYVIDRDQTSISKLSLGLAHANSQVEQDFYGVRTTLVSQTRNTTAMVLGATRTTKSALSYQAMSAQMEFGLGLFNATDKSSIAFGDYERDYRLLRLSYSKTKAMEINAIPVTMTYRLGAQYSNDNLLTANRVVLGGTSHVRGAKSAIGTGNSGVWGGLDFVYQGAASKFSLSFEMGKSQDKFADTQETVLKSVTWGMSKPIGRLALDLSVTKVIDAKGAMGDRNPASETAIQFGISTVF